MDSLFELVHTIGVFWTPFLILLVAVFYLQRFYLSALMQAGGRSLVLVPASFSVPVHELSHYLMAKLMGHKIIEVKFFTPNQSGTLGYVRHQWRPSWFSPFSNMLIGLAPVFGGVVSVFGLTLYLQPELYELLSNADTQYSVELWSSIEKTIVSATDTIMANKSDPVFWVWYVLVANIFVFCVPSSVDFHGAAKGIIITLLLYIALASQFPIINAFHQVMLHVASLARPMVLMSAALVVFSIPFLILIGKLSSHGE